MTRLRGAGARAIVTTVLFCGSAACADPAAKLSAIRLPSGFSIEVYSGAVPGARSLALGAGGTLFVSTRGEGKVYALPDRNHDGVVDEVLTIASGLKSPNGVALLDGALYVAEISRVLRYDAIEDHLTDVPKPAVVYDQLPKDKHHGWKFIRFGPDGWLYVPVGAPCNICKQRDERYAAILRMKPDGSSIEVFSHGVRNTVGFDWDPATKELWFTDNGRDWLGDDQPSDELNHAPKAGLHFGYPFCHGKATPDPEFGRVRPCAEFIPAGVELGAHVAALGMRFYTGTSFPENYRNAIFIAQHGSWNRSKPSGYRVMVVPMKDGKPSGYEVFAEGWLDGDRAWGRPVDVLVMPDGSLLVSDDKQGAVYRIRYGT